MSNEPDLPRDLLDLATAVADGYVLPTEGMLGQAGEPRVRANLKKLALLAGAHDTGEESRKNVMRWGHLEVGELLGSGGFGKVYDAWDTVLQRAVALKLRHDDAADLDAMAWIEEARRLARVRHPHVLAVHGADVHDGKVGMWSDLIHGETLEARLQLIGQMPPQQALPLSQQLAEAVAAVHATDLVHGDIKASNIMLDESDAVVLMDFGAGNERGGSGHYAGSPLSMAPELFGNATPDPASDMYAIGVVLFRLLSGRYPLDVGTLDELKARHQEGTEPDWASLPRSTGRPMHALLQRMLAREPAQRPSAGDLVERLRWIRAAPQRRRKRTTVAVVIGALAIGLIAASAGYLHARRSAQQALAAQAETESINGFLRDILASPRPTASGRKTLMTEVLEQANRHLADRFANQARLGDSVRAVLAGSFESLGDNAEAARLREIILDRYQREGAPSDAARREITYALANNYIELRRFEDAKRLVALAEPTTAAVNRQPTRLDVVCGSVETALAVWQGKPELANELAEANWNLARSILSPYDSHYALSRYQLGQSLYELGRFVEAQPLLADAVSESVALVGERHARSLRARQLLTAVEARMGHLDRAEVLATTNLEVAAAWLGETDRWTINAMSTLSNVRGARGAFAEAMELNTRALAASRVAYGDDHPNTLILLGNQASKLEDIGWVADAETLWVEGIERMRRVLGENHKMTLTNRGNLAELWFDSGRASEAEAALRDIVPRFQQHYGASAIGSLHFSDLLGKILVARGAHSEAVALLAPGLQEARAAAGMQSPHAQDLLATLAAAEVDAGLREQALAHWRELHTLRLAGYGEEDETTRAAAAAIASLESE